MTPSIIKKYTTAYPESKEGPNQGENQMRGTPFLAVLLKNCPDGSLSIFHCPQASDVSISSHTRTAVLWTAPLFRHRRGEETHSLSSQPQPVILLLYVPCLDSCSVPSGKRTSRSISRGALQDKENNQRRYTDSQLLLPE